MNAHAARLARARSAMESAEVDVLLLSIGPELPYLTGYEAMDTERLTMLVVGRHDPIQLIVPQLEHARVGPVGAAVETIAWAETDDPLAIVADLVGSDARVGMGERTRSTFLLGLQDRLPGASFTGAGVVLDGLRLRKDAAEIDALRTVAHAADRVSDQLDQLDFRGRTELAVAADVAALLREEGHESVEFTIVASGPNGASPHHEPGRRVIEAGDAVVLDFGGRIDGYFSDTTRNVVVGEPPPGYDEIHDLVDAAHAAAAAAVRPGVTAESVDRAARSIIEDAGHGDEFMHRTGHGIGLEGHEAPYIVEGNATILEPGMAFSIEPGIYLEGRYGVRIEDIAIVTDSGVELLNEAAHRYQVV